MFDHHSNDWRSFLSTLVNVDLEDSWNNKKKGEDKTGV